MLHIPGYHFTPTDEELITFYLLKKVKGEELPKNKKVIERDVYSDAPWNVFAPEDPWVTLETTDTMGYKKFKSNIYAITLLKKKTNTSRTARIAGCGTWHGENKAEFIRNRRKEVIGFKKRFVFEARGGSSVNVGRFKSGHWIMQEYTLTDTTQVYVLCKITRDDSKPLKRSRQHGDNQICDEQQQRKRMMTCSERSHTTTYSTNTSPLEASTSIPVMPGSCDEQPCRQMSCFDMPPPLLCSNEGIINTTALPKIELPVQHEGGILDTIAYITNPLPLEALTSVPMMAQSYASTFTPSVPGMPFSPPVLESDGIINASSNAALPLEFDPSVPLLPSSSHAEGYEDCLEYLTFDYSFLDDELTILPETMPHQKGSQDLPCTLDP